MTTTKLVNVVESDAIRPFQVNVPEADLIDLRRRIVATRLPEKETVGDFTQGVPLATVQKLARYWATDYDWRKVEARLNAVPNFITKIDGLDIHFIHVRSKHENALPVIITHGWPGSIVEQLKLIEPLTNPTAHGGTAADAFDVVIPNMPGYGFSGKPTGRMPSNSWGASTGRRRAGKGRPVRLGCGGRRHDGNRVGTGANRACLGRTNMPGIFPNDIS
jgi:hypothetical protein